MVEPQNADDNTVTEASFRLKVDRFSHLKQIEGGASSQPYYINGLAWRILVLPRERSFAAFVECQGEPGSDFWSCKAYGELRLIPQTYGRQLKSHQIEHTFYRGRSWAGFKESCNGYNTYSSTDCYVEKDSLVVEAWISAQPTTASGPSDRP